MDNDDFDDCTYMCNSNVHQKRVAWTFTIAGSVSGTLSIIGSSLIIFIILRRRSLNFFRNRIIFMLSVFDVINSFALALFTLASPPEDAWGRPTIGIGNRGTCIAQGIAIQMGATVVPAYNAILCCYYTGVIKYSQEDSDLAKKYERFIHPTAIFLPLCSAIIGCAKELFESNGQMCWFQIMTSSSSDPAFILIFLTAFWNFMSSVVINVSMWSTYRSVRKTHDNMTRYRFPGEARQHEQQSLLGKIIPCCKKRENPEREVVTTYRQSLLFFFGHTITYIWTAISLTILMAFYLRGDQRDQPHQPLELEFLQSLFLPLQGFWNFVAFVHPRFMLMKADYPELGFFSILIKVVLDRSQLTVPVIRSLPPTAPAIGGSLPNNIQQNHSSQFTQEVVEIANIQESEETYLQDETADHERSPRMANSSLESQYDLSLDPERPSIEDGDIFDEEDLEWRIRNNPRRHSSNKIGFESMVREETNVTPRRHSLPDLKKSSIVHTKNTDMNGRRGSMPF